MKADLPIEAKAFLDALAVGEDVDPRDYDELYGSTKANPKKFDASTPTLDGHYGFPAWGGWNDSHAAGRYQFEPATWKAVCENLWPANAGTPDFRNPDHQDLGGWLLGQDDYNRRTQRLLRGDLIAGAFTNVASALQKTWTSLNVLTLSNRYKAALAKYQFVAMAPPVAAPNEAPPSAATAIPPYERIILAPPPEDPRLTGAKIALKMIADGKADAVMIAKLALTMMGDT